MSAPDFMESMAREALSRYPSKGQRSGYYQRLIKKKTTSLGKEGAEKFVTDLKDLMRIEWKKQNPNHDR